MKKILYFLSIALTLVGATSCDKEFLNVQPLDRFADQAVWNDPILIQDYINNIYVGIGHGFAGSLQFALSDECMWPGYEKHCKSNIGPTDISGFGGNFDPSCQNAYKNIRACNQFFEKIETSANIDKATKDKMRGEVFFMRAYVYSKLVSFYGGVPIIKNVYGLNDDFLAPRNSFEECINRIVSDCDSAASLVNPSDKGRPTKGAALALKSRILLYAASDLYNSNGSWAGDFAHPELISYIGGDRTVRWQKAKDAAKDVIDLGIYSLYKGEPVLGENIAKNYGDIFTLKETTEDIFVRFISPDLGFWWGQNNPGLLSQPNGWHCWGAGNPYNSLVDNYEMADGTKFSWTNPVQAADPYENREPRFYASILYDGAVWKPRPLDLIARDSIGIVQASGVEKWDAKTSKIITIWGMDTRRGGVEDWNGGYTSYYIRKGMDPKFDAQFFRQDAPWRYIRYTEVLLNYAEACIGLVKEDEAKIYINKIRKRAGLPDITETGQDLVDRYRNERRLELVFEEHRFFDVRRWMIASQTYQNAEGLRIIHKLNADKITTTPAFTKINVQTRTWNDRFYFLPIGLDEMNKNSNLIQNPLY